MKAITNDPAAPDKGHEALGRDGFEHYAGLGVRRSYSAVASHFGVTRHAVSRVAQRQDWRERIAARARAEREAADQAFVEREVKRGTQCLDEAARLENRKFELLTRYRVKTFDEAVDVLVISAALTACAWRGPAIDGNRIADRIADELLRCMYRSGQITRDELIEVLGPEAGAE